MRAVVLSVLLAGLSACGANPPCTACPDISGEYTLALDPVSAEKSTCLRYYTDGALMDVVVQQEGSEVQLQPMGWRATLYEDLSLRFESWDGETQEGHPTREHLKGRVTLEPKVTFKGTLTAQIPSQSCAISVPVSWY